MISDGVLHAVRGRVEEFQQQKRTPLDLPSSSAGTTAALTDNDENHYDFLEGRLTSSSKLVQASTIKTRNLQESACANSTSSIDVSSTVFPLIEGCYAPYLSDDELWYITETALILPLESNSSSDVSEAFDQKFKDFLPLNADNGTSVQADLPAVTSLGLRPLGVDILRSVHCKRRNFLFVIELGLCT